MPLSALWLYDVPPACTVVRAFAAHTAYSMLYRHSTDEIGGGAAS